MNRMFNDYFKLVFLSSAFGIPQRFANLKVIYIYIYIYDIYMYIYIYIDR